jgi:hypothetical protein
MGLVDKAYEYKIYGVLITSSENVAFHLYCFKKQGPRAGLAFLPSLTVLRWLLEVPLAPPHIYPGVLSHWPLEEDQNVKPLFWW